MGFRVASVIPSARELLGFQVERDRTDRDEREGLVQRELRRRLKVSGTAQGALSGTVVTWSANGVAQAPLVPSCAITLTGTAKLGVNSIRVPYNGTT